MLGPLCVYVCVFTHRSINIWPKIPILITQITSKQKSRYFYLKTENFLRRIPDKNTKNFFLAVLLVIKTVYTRTTPTNECRFLFSYSTHNTVTHMNTYVYRIWLHFFQWLCVMGVFASVCGVRALIHIHRKCSTIIPHNWEWCGKWIPMDDVAWISAARMMFVAFEWQLWSLRSVAYDDGSAIHSYG